MNVPSWVSYLIKVGSFMCVFSGWFLYSVRKNDWILELCTRFLLRATPCLKLTYFLMQILCGSTCGDLGSVLFERGCVHGFHMASDAGLLRLIDLFV